MGESKHVFRVFLSYAREDKAAVEDLYAKLLAAGFQPWMDTKDILPGEVWMESINAAIEHSDFFLACLSPNSVIKRGVLQKEFRSAQEAWQKMLDSDIYFIPVKLADCDVPDSMRKFQWVDLFENEGFALLEEALKKGVERRTAGLPPARPRKDVPFPAGMTVSQVKRLLEASVRTARTRPASFLGSILGLFLAVSGLPWAFNNFVYDVKRPILPETCQVSSEPVRIGLSKLSGCSPEFQDQLAASWMGTTMETSLIPQSLVSRDQARRLTNYDIVVWGACKSSEPEEANLTFELLSSRKPDGVYEPSSLDISGGMAELSDAGVALSHYQHGDYVDAAALFDSLRALLNSTIVNLFKSNSLLFAERYDTAIKSYEEMIQAEDMYSAAAYNNMGVAYFSQDLNQGLDQFDRSIELAANYQATEIEALALLNRSKFFLLRSEWKSADKDCEALLKLNGQSALPYVCRAGYNFIYYRFQPFGIPPLREINRKLSEAEKYEDAPALVQYVRGEWNNSHFWKRKQDAVDNYYAYLKHMENRACLQFDREYISAAREKIQELTRP